MILEAALVAVLSISATAQQEASGGVTGEVRGVLDGASRPLAHALLEVRSGDVRRTAVAGPGGRYRLAGLPAGPALLRVVHIGYGTLELEVLVPAGRTVEVDLELMGVPVPVAPVTVRGDPSGAGDGARAVPRIELVETEFRAMESGTGMLEAGLGEAARAGSGNPPGDPTDVLFMRGSTADLKLVLLDGAPVFTPFHLGGLIKAFEPAMLGRSTLHLGGAPARYDGGLSYIMDLRTRTPRRDRIHSTGSLDLMSARATVEGPLGPAAGFTISGRGLHGAQNELVADGPRPYGYTDALVRLDVSPTEGHTLRATGFWNRESVFLDLSRGAPPESGRPWTPDDASWGNRVGALGYEAILGETTVELGGALTRYDARLPLGGTVPTFAEGVYRQGRLTADVRTPAGSGRVGFGASYSRVRTQYGSMRGDSVGAVTETREEGSVVGAYGEALLPLAPGVQLRTGLRADHFSTRSGVRFAPRAALTWALTSDAILTLAAGRYHQYGQASTENVDAVLGNRTASVDDDALLPVASASHVLVSLDQMVSPGLRLGLDGFFKVFEEVDGVEGSRLNSSGVDLRVVREGERSTGWLGYSLSWFWTVSPGSDSASDFAGRQLLSAGFASELGSRLGIDLRLGFGDGLPFTTVPLAEEYLTVDFPDLESTAVQDDTGVGIDRVRARGGDISEFLRIDAEIYGIFRAGSTGRHEIRPYIRVLNALDRRDALFYYFEPWREEQARPLAELPLLPVLGVEWRF